MLDEESQLLEKCLIGLAECEKEMDEAEKEAEIYRIKKTQKIYENRRNILKKIPKFWYIVLAENDDFSEYVSVEDLKYLEMINDIYVHYKVADADVSELKNHRDFSITISFKDDSDGLLVPNQEVTKYFETIIENGEEKIISKPVEAIWPGELDYINPTVIKEKNKGKEMSKEVKKNYRQGMKSFFAWFNWTGEKPGKEFRNGEDLTRLIIDDLFPYAVKYYTEALPGNEEYDDEDDDSSEGEELDISDEEDASDKKRSLGDTDDQPNKKRK